LARPIARINASQRIQIGFNPARSGQNNRLEAYSTLLSVLSSDDPGESTEIEKALFSS
jgi:hypothetical protein